MKNTLNNERLTIMKLENINFNGKSYNLRIDRYASSNFIAILRVNQMMNIRMLSQLITQFWKKVKIMILSMFKSELIILSM